MLLATLLGLLLARTAALRFEVGDRVECHLGEQKWETGRVSQLHVDQEDENSQYVAPYLIRLDSGDEVVAPRDDDRFIRREGQGPPQPMPSRMFRFAIGTRVECNLGIHWERGTVMRLNYQVDGGAYMPYQVRLDSGNMIYAPEDDDSVIRREGTMQLTDPALRFGVGDRVECVSDSGDGSRRWYAGAIVGLHYHEPRFGEGKTAPYQVKLDEGGRLIFVTIDNDEAIRREAGASGILPAAAQKAASVSKSSKISKTQLASRRTKTIGVSHAGSKLGGSKAGRAGKFGGVQSTRPRGASPPKAQWSNGPGPGGLPADELR